MCGGMFRRDERPEREHRAPPQQPAQQYKPPSLDSLYQAFRESGTVPYSYYGAGAPTREGELPLVQQSYPGAFTPQPQQQSDPLANHIRRYGRR